jgi:methanethiol oxidase
MPEATDPTFYRSPGAAMAAPAEELAYVAAFDPSGRVNDAMTVIDCAPSSPTFGGVVGWSERINHPHRLRSALAKAMRARIVLADD